MRTVAPLRTSLTPTLAIVLLLCACRATDPAAAGGVPAPPPTRTDDVLDVLHGVQVADPYRWLENQESSETRAWIEAQNAYTDAVLATVPDREALEQLAERMTRIDSVGTPVERGGRYFYMRQAAEEELAALYVREGAFGEARVLVDPHTMSDDLSVNVSMLDVSDDGRRLAYGVRHGGADEVEVRVLDVDTGRDVAGGLPAALYIGVELGGDGAGLYYSRYVEDDPHIWYHALDADPAADRSVFGGSYGQRHLVVGTLSEDGERLLVHVLDGTSGPTELHLVDVESGEARVVVADGHSRPMAAFAGDLLVINTDLDAPNRRVCVADVSDPGVVNWRELVPERDDAVLQSATPVAGGVWVSHLANVREEVRFHELASGAAWPIEFGTLGSTGQLSGRFGSKEAFVGYSSFHVPPTIYRFDLGTSEREVWAETDIPVDTENIEVTQVHYASKDGTRVPMFVVHRKDIELNGEAPTILSGYGGFELSLTPSFSGLAAAWVEHGGVFAVANIRGGGELGKAWHEAGMLGSKQSVFDDFIAAGEYLVARGYTSTDKLAILGGSNGGLLTGAMIVQRPDLFGAVICTYPLLDMVRYHMFMAGQYWVAEYGCSDEADQFEFLFAYSPYHRVEGGTHYPATLFITGDGDTRVAPLHARKMAAALQAANASDEPILLRYHIEAGHSGGQTTKQQIAETVDIWSFLMREVAWQPF